MCPLLTARDRRGRLCSSPTLAGGRGVSENRETCRVPVGGLSLHCFGEAATALSSSCESSLGVREEESDLVPEGGFRDAGEPGNGAVHPCPVGALCAGVEHGRQAEASDRSQEAGGQLLRQVPEGGCAPHALHGKAGRWDRIRQQPGPRPAVYLHLGDWTSH